MASHVGGKSRVYGGEGEFVVGKEKGCSSVTTERRCPRQKKKKPGDLAARGKKPMVAKKGSGEGCSSRRSTRTREKGEKTPPSPRWEKFDSKKPPWSADKRKASKRGKTGGKRVCVLFPRGRGAPGGKKRRDLPSGESCCFSGGGENFPFLGGGKGGGLLLGGNGPAFFESEKRGRAKLRASFPEKSYTGGKSVLPRVWFPNEGKVFT